MHAILLVVDLSQSDREESLKNLREVVVPQVREAPGFKSGVWLGPASAEAMNGTSVVVFETAENAQAAASQVPVGATVGPGVTVVSCEVREVAASA
jgi:hypothetical protein